MSQSAFIGGEIPVGIPPDKINFPLRCICPAFILTRICPVYEFRQKKGKEMNIALSDHFTYKRLLRFTLPSIAMMIFTSIYGVVDGFFVSNFVGKIPFAAVNFIMPFLMILGAFGFMFGTGGSALVAKIIGEGDPHRARRVFSLITYVSVGLGTVVAILGIAFIEPVAALLGAEGEMLENCVIYGRIILAALPFFMLQQQFQSFFVAAEKPGLGLATTVAAGVANMVLDALFIAVFRWEVVGAAAATAISQLIGGLIPLIYFSSKNSSLLRLGRADFDLKALCRVCINGSSELMSNISMSLVGMLYNFQLMKYAEEDGVAAYGTLMYVGFIFVAAFIGYSIGTAPVISYNYGAANHEELKSVLKKSLVIISVFSLSMFILGEVLAFPLSFIFTGYDEGLLALTLRGFLFYSFSFLFCGFSIYGSGFFTALNNGVISAVISFLRTLVLQVAAILIMPLILGTDGIWLSVVVSELLAAVVCFIFLIANRRKYNY